MSFAEIFNLIDTFQKVVEQDPLSFMVVYPLTLMTGIMLLYALVQDFISVHEIAFPRIAFKTAAKRLAISTTKGSDNSGKQVRFSSRHW